MDTFENNTPEEINTRETPEETKEQVLSDAQPPVPAESETELLRETAAQTELQDQPEVMEAPEDGFAYAPPAQQPEYEQQPVAHAAGKPSPFADSPYVVNHTQQVQAIPGKPRRKKKGNFWKTAVSAVLILCLVAGACVTTGAVVNEYWQDRMDRMEESFEDKLDALQQKVDRINTGVSVSGSPVSSVDGGLTPAQVYAQNVNSVVIVYNQITASYYGQTGTGVSTGSGFVLSEDGYIVTNYHVVEGNGSLSVVTWDGREYTAQLVGSDSTNDVALLKVEATDLQAVTLGSSDDLIVGDQVVAIGNPLGELTSTLTVGYVSAKERDVNTDGFAINMLQTDAAINSGNSGGPLFNMKGEVVGITTAKYSGTSSSGATIEGVGFAIPIDDVSGLLADLATYGYVTGAYMGVSVSDMDPAAANYYGMPVGAYVQLVEAGYAAQRAGIQPKDIIVDIGGYEVGTVNDLTRALRNFSAGENTIVTVYRGGREIKLPITLDAKPASVAEDETP